MEILERLPKALIMGPFEEVIKPNKGLVNIFQGLIKPLEGLRASGRIYEIF